MAKTVDELPVYRRAVALCAAVSALLQRPTVRRNRKTWEQLVDANDSIVANIEEGFEQTTDAAFANYLVYSKGSLAEVRARLRQARTRNELSSDDLAPVLAEAKALSHMLGGFINYLRRSDFKDRGTFQAKSRLSRDGDGDGDGDRDGDRDRDRD
jgi:four helix bundle protein